VLASAGFHDVPLAGTITEGEHGQSDMVMPSLPDTSFVVAQPQLILELLVVLLDYYIYHY